MTHAIYAPAPLTERRIIDPIAFAFALLGAPILVAIAGFWLLLIPIAALGFGYIPYLVVGGPFFFWLLKRQEPTNRVLAGYSLLAMAIVLAATLGLHLLLPGNDWDAIAILFALFFG